MDEKVSKKHWWREEVRVSMSWHERGGKKERDGENLAKCSAQISLSTKLKENRSLGTEEEVEEEHEGKEKLISINKWSEEFSPKSVWTSQENEWSISAREGLTRDKSIIEEDWDELGAIRVFTPWTLMQKRSWEAKYKQRSSDFEESLETREPQEGCWRLKSPTTNVGDKRRSVCMSSWKQELSPAPRRQ